MVNWDDWWQRPPSDDQIREWNEKLMQLSGVVHTLHGYSTERNTTPVIYRFLATNLYEVWKRHVTTLKPRTSLQGDVAREIGYAALSVYSVGAKSEQNAFVRSVRLIAELLVGWEYQGQTQPNLRIVKEPQSSDGT